MGDVHGCADELENLLQKCQYKKENEIVVFNGDIINKGPKSVQVFIVAVQHNLIEWVQQLVVEQLSKASLSGHIWVQLPASIPLKQAGCLQVIDKIQSMNAIAVRGNQDDKALAAYVRWKDGKALVGTTYLVMQP